jgi:hypothetical protein
MNEKQKEDLKLKVLQFLRGQTLERNKLEFKSKWYDLSWIKRSGENGREIRNGNYFEFLKDCVAIINSYGRDEGYIIIGVNESTKECIDTNLTDSGLDDSSKIKDIVIGNIDKAFLIDIDYINVDGKQLSVIHIPPSIDKPHLIAEYWSQNNHFSRNVIWIKNGSGSEIATRGDIDRMYWERSNIILDKKVEVAFDLRQMKFYRMSEDKIGFTGKISLENQGTKTLMIRSMQISIIVGASLRYVFFDTNNNDIPLKLQPQDPIYIGATFLHLISNLYPNQMKSLIDNLESSKYQLTYESVIIKLANHEEIFAIPIISKPG